MMVNDFDDEHTLDEEEDLMEEDTKEEIDELTKVSGQVQGAWMPVSFALDYRFMQLIFILLLVLLGRKYANWRTARYVRLC